MCRSAVAPPPTNPSLVEDRSDEPVEQVALAPVDEVRVTVLVDNAVDSLAQDRGPVHRARLRAARPVASALFREGATIGGLVAEHGFSALVTVRRDGRSHTVLFDAGVSPSGMAANMERLEVDPSAIEAVVLSHGHFDHVGGLDGLRRLRPGGLPIVVHPALWTKRRVALPGAEPVELPTLSRSSLEGEGFAVVEDRRPSLLLDGALLVTGEVRRTTPFERGMPYHEAFDHGRWVPDPLIADDQALVVHLRGAGLVVVTGCGHAGAVNIVQGAQRLTGVRRLHGLLGGLHLTGGAFEPVIEPTVSALADYDPAVVVPGHCTGSLAQHRLATVLGERVVPILVGTTVELSGA